MTLVAIRNGLVATIVDYGAWTAAQVSTCDFGIATTSGSCVVLQPGAGTVIEPLTFMGGGVSRGKRNIWEISGIVLIKDPGNPTTFLGMIWQAADDIYSSVNSDDSFDGTCMAGMIRTISRPSIDAFIDTGGTVFAFLTFSVRAEEIVG